MQFGDDDDMSMYFDGTRLKITPKTSSTTSQLDFEAKDQVYIESLSNGIFLRASGNNVIDMYGGSGGGIYFHHNGNDKLKLEGGNWTTQGNADWNFIGTNYDIRFDASDGALEFEDNAKAKFGAGDDLQLFHNGANSVIDGGGVGNLFLLPMPDTDSETLADTEDIVKFDENGPVEIYHDNSKKFETTGAGVIVTGIATATSFVKSGGTSSQYLMADGSVTTSGGGGGGLPDINSLSDGRTTALSVGLGTGALANDDGTDNGNVAVGYSALHKNTTGLYNVAIGKHAMGISTNASVNVFIGRDAGRVLTSGSSNAVVG